MEEESWEDVPDLKHATNVTSLSAGQVERHRVSHLPCRSWCKQCVMGRGVGRPHATSPTESSAPIVSMDYFCIAKEGVRRRDQLAKEMAEHLPPGAGEVSSDAEESGTVDEAISKARTTAEFLKCLLARCLRSKNVFAHVIPQKGDDEDHCCAKMAAAYVE